MEENKNKDVIDLRQLYKKIKERKRLFMKEHLPEMFRQMRLLDIDIKDIVEAWIK